MDAAPIFGTAVSILGALIAFVGVVYKISSSRGKHYLERSTGLLLLRKELSDQGAYEGRTASTESEEAHRRLLATLDLESRANAVLYLNSAGRLARPGSYVLASVYGVYALSMGYLLLLGLALPTNGTDPTSATVALLFQLVTLLTLAWLSVWQFRRRRQSLRIRRAVGTIDELTIEGLAWSAREWRRAFRAFPNSFRPASRS